MVEGGYSKRYHTNLKDFLGICFDKCNKLVMQLWREQAEYSPPCLQAQAEVSEGISLRSAQRPKRHVWAVTVVTRLLSMEDPGHVGSRTTMTNKESQGKEDHIKQFCSS